MDYFIGGVIGFLVIAGWREFVQWHYRRAGKAMIDAVIAELKLIEARQ